MMISSLFQDVILCTGGRIRITCLSIILKIKTELFKSANIRAYK